MSKHKEDISSLIEEAKQMIKTIETEELETLRQALSGDRGEDQKRIAVEGVSLISLLLSKNADYGGSAWKSPLLAPGMTAREAIQCRMSDKIERFRNLIQQEGRAEIEESIEDTISDLTGYGILWMGAPV